MTEAVESFRELLPFSMSYLLLKSQDRKGWEV